MDLSTSKNESIKNLIESLEKGNIALPEFQRDFVWDTTRTYDLFDSLIKDIFIGSIIFGKPSFEIAIREIDNRPRKGKDRNRKLKISPLNRDEIKKKVEHDNFRIILDGQQRITSLYRALNDIDEVWFIVENDSDYDESDKNILMKDINERSLEEILHAITGEEDKSRLSVKLGDVYKIIKNYYIDDDIKEKFFKKMSYLSNFNQSTEEYRNVFKKYLTCIKKIRSIITGEDRVLSYYLLDMSIDKFALFFERSNSKGIILNFTDILAAKLYSGFKLRDKIEEFENKNSNLKDYFNKEIIIRTIAYIEGEGNKKIDKAFILKILDYNHFKKYWDKVCDWYKQSLNFLYGNHFIISQSWMPYENMLIPLMIFIKELGKDFSQIDSKQSKFIHYWYWSSVFSQRYSGSSNEMIIKDAKYMQSIAKNERIAEKAYFNRLSRLQITNYKDLFDYSKKGNAVYQGVLNIINYNSKGLIGWKNSDKLNFNDSELEDHHIFPKNYVKKKFKGNQDLIDKTESVVNRTLIPKIDNREISDSSPSSYLKLLKKNNTNLEKSLKNHLIPTEIIDGVYDNSCQDFYEKRAKDLFEIIEKVVINKQNEILSLFYKEQEISESGHIRIFAKYSNKILKATFNIATQKVLYKGDEYTPSGAANKAKEELSGKNDHSTNGWEFWKFKDDEGNEKFIKELKRD